MAKKLSPIIIARDGSRYRLVIMRVIAEDDDRPPVAKMENSGQPLLFPRELRVIDVDEAAEVCEGDRFVTAYVPESVFGPAVATQGK